MLPDRGWNVAGTADYRARLNKLSITFKPADASAAMPAADRQRSVVATLADTILLTDRARSGGGRHTARGERLPGSAAGIERPRQHRRRGACAAAGWRLFHR